MHNSNLGSSKSNDDDDDDRDDVIYIEQLSVRADRAPYNKNIMKLLQIFFSLVAMSTVSHQSVKADLNRKVFRCLCVLCADNYPHRWQCPLFLVSFYRDKSEKNRLPRRLLYGELLFGQKLVGRQKLRYSDHIKLMLRKCNIPESDLETENRGAQHVLLVCKISRQHLSK